MKCSRSVEKSRSWPEVISEKPLLNGIIARRNMKDLEAIAERSLIKQPKIF
jgi:hypothetical protein